MRQLALAAHNMLPLGTPLNASSTSTRLSTCSALDSGQWQLYLLQTWDLTAQSALSSPHHNPGLTRDRARSASALAMMSLKTVSSVPPLTGLHTLAGLPLAASAPA